MRLRSSESSRSRTTAPASADSSLGGTSNPVSPSSTWAGSPPTAVATTGFENVYATGMTPLCVASVGIRQDDDARPREELRDLRIGNEPIVHLEPRRVGHLAPIDVEVFALSRNNDLHAGHVFLDYRHRANQVLEALVRPDTPEEEQQSIFFSDTGAGCVLAET